MDILAKWQVRGRRFEAWRTEGAENVMAPELALFVREPGEQDWDDTLTDEDVIQRIVALERRNASLKKRLAKALAINDFHRTLR